MIAEYSRREHQHGEGQCVSVHNPLQAGYVYRQVRRNTRQCDVDDGDVELSDDKAEAGSGDDLAQANPGGGRILRCRDHASWGRFGNLASSFFDSLQSAEGTITTPERRYISQPMYRKKERWREQ